MSASILITQCLQNDFVQPLAKFEPMPNKLHIGYAEAQRLIGINPSNGPVHKLMEWAYSTQNHDRLKIIHIRDWHDDKDPAQSDHLIRFGNHCIKNTPGANFVFENSITSHAHDTIVNASGLNDFKDTHLAALLDPYKNKPLKVGLVGVWTEAKISFLAYELITRYPTFEVALCSALTAGSSTAMHFIALDSLKNILGIKIIASVSEFTSYLTGSIPSFEISESFGTSIEIAEDHHITSGEKQLLQYLFRNEKSVIMKILDGGFSGNLVVKAEATDQYGHKQVPVVIKVGPRALIAKERESFERIKEVLGNNAPQIIDFAENEQQGALKYRYAAMFGDRVLTLQQHYVSHYQADRIKKFLTVVFKEQLGRLYDARRMENMVLLSYYDFSSKYAERVKTKAEELIGPIIPNEPMTIAGVQVYNVVDFYQQELDQMEFNLGETYFMAYQHGDLNGANIIIDGQENVWLIDFFHTHYGHVLKDLIKFENDLLFIFTAISNETEWHEGKQLIDHLMSVPDLGIGITPLSFSHEPLNRAMQTLIILRSFYSDWIETLRDPYQYHVAMLRYAMHTLSFDECSPWQKKLALYMGACCAEKILQKHTSSRKLRIDFLDDPAQEFPGKGKIGLTILPGRVDRNRSLDADMAVMKEKGIKHILCLITKDEMENYGVPQLLQQYKDNQFDLLHIPIKDQGIPSSKDLQIILDWLHQQVDEKSKIMIHCVGGLGRTGTIAALFLKHFGGFTSEQAIDIVRKSRSPRAIESEEQVNYVQSF